MPNAIAKASKHELKCAWDILAQAAAKQQHQEQQEGQGAGQSRAIDGIDGRPASCPCPCPCRRLLLPLPCCDLNRNGATRGRQNQIEVCPVAAADSSPSPSRPSVHFFLLSVCVFFAFFTAHWLWLHWLILLPLVAVAAFGF